MPESPTPLSRLGVDPEQEPLEPMWERIAAIYQSRSRSLARLFHFRGAGNHRTEVVTPFLDPMNARISVFIEMAGEDFVICDGGLALKIVRMSQRKDGLPILHALVQDYGLSLSGDSLHVVSTEADLLAKQFRLCNALVSLRDRLSAGASG